jgi:TetR/AcrR family transcriptional regulator
MSSRIDTVTLVLNQSAKPRTPFWNHRDELRLRDQMSGGSLRRRSFGLPRFVRFLKSDNLLVDKQVKPFYKRLMGKSLRRAPEVGRAELLDAATDLFAEFGFDRTSLAAVGERAGVSRGLPGYFFGSKESLYNAVMDRATARVREAILPSVQLQPAEASIDEVLRSFVTIYLEFLNASPWAVRLLQWESLNPTHLRQSSPAALFDEIAVYVARALKTSGYSEVSPNFLLLSVVGMCFFPFRREERFRDKPEVLAAYREHVLRLALGGSRKVK